MLWHQRGAASVLAGTRESISLAAQGLISQNFDRQVVQANVQLTSGTVYAMGIPLVAGQVVTNGHVMISVAGADVTTGKIGLLSPAGARVALSANQTTEWQSTGAKTAAFSSAYTVPATGLYYVAVICIASTTQPSLYRAATTTLNNVIGTGQKPFGAEASQTDIDATVDLGASGLALWAGLS